MPENPERRVAILEDARRQVYTPYDQCYDIAPPGPGRILDDMYRAGHRFLDCKISKIAHNRGHGPGPAALRIKETLLNNGAGERTREEALYFSFKLGREDVHDEISKEVAKDCLKLMKYAHPYVFNS
jgi:hypothetical protein